MVLQLSADGGDEQAERSAVWRYDLHADEYSAAGAGCFALCRAFGLHGNERQEQNVHAEVLWRAGRTSAASAGQLISRSVSATAKQSIGTGDCKAVHRYWRLQSSRHDLLS